MKSDPFKTIVTAVALSPNMEANIHESIRLKNKLGKKLILVHVGPKTIEAEREFVRILAEAKAGADSVEIIWEEGDPVNAILKVADEKDGDLIVAGAISREGLVRYYKGSVARRLVRKANCSVLLMTHPSKLKNICGNVVVNGLDHPKTAYTIQAAVQFAVKVGARNLTIIEEVEPQKVETFIEDESSLQQAIRRKRKLEEEEHSRIDKILNSTELTENLNITQKCIFGKRGYSIGHYAETSCADLLVMNSPDTKLGFLDRVFTHDLEYILSELPCDLLIVHSHR